MRRANPSDLSRRLFLGGAAVAACPGAAQDLNFTAAIGDLRGIAGDTTAMFQAEADRILARRRAPRTREELIARGKATRERMLRNIGGLPTATPLNARTVGTLDRGAYRIEKVVFESQPNFPVTANLYLPKSTGRHPAILFPLGHEPGGKAHESWQHILGGFATKGFVALAWDPLGQGERSQFYDPDLGDTKLAASTREHTMLGAQCLLAGDNVARYMIHDGIRALDYLASRPEVDPEKIGVTGNSGGGTMTAYLAAIDPRLKAAAPSCYITSWKSLLEQLGPQDAEQNLPPWLGLGHDFPDFLYAFSGKPYLILSAIRDFFPIGGARATHAEARWAYEAAGLPDHLAMFEADDGHGYTQPRRVAAYRWMSRWLAGRSDDGVEPEVKLATEQELWCHAQGHVDTRSETVHSLNRKRVAAISRPPFDAARILRAAREVSGYRDTDWSPRISRYGTLDRGAYRLEKLTYESEPGVRVAAVLAVPAQPASTPPLLIADARGKSFTEEELDREARTGRIVLSIDIRGCGELAAPSTRGADPWFGDARTTTTAFHFGRTYAALRAADITAGLHLLASRRPLAGSGVEGRGRGAAALPMLLAAAVDDRLRELRLDGLLRSYASVIDARLHRGVYEQLLPGVLKHFDIPDLIRAIAPRKVHVERFVDPMGATVTGQR